MVVSSRRYLVTFGPHDHRQVMTAPVEDVPTLVRLLLDNRCPHVELDEVDAPTTATTGNVVTQTTTGAWSYTAWPPRSSTQPGASGPPGGPRP